MSLIGFGFVVVVAVPCLGVLELHQEWPTECPRVASKCDADVALENEHITKQLHSFVRGRQVGKIQIGGEVALKGMNMSLALLEQGKQVVKAACPNTFVSHRMLDDIVHLFKFLLLKMEGTRYFEDKLSNRKYMRAFEGLVKCQESFYSVNYPYRFFSDDDGCPVPLIRQICQVKKLPDGTDDTRLSLCHELTLRKARVCPRNNVLLEIVWSMIDLVNGACLPEFQQLDAVSLYHVWQQSQEGLFSRKILRFWYQNLLPVEVYQSLVHSDVMEQLYNLEMCVEAMYSVKSGLENRLLRPTLPRRVFRRKRQLVNQPKEYLCP